MDQDKLDMMVRLQRLDAQVRDAISYLQSDMPLFPIQDEARVRETPNEFHIGDFTIKDRFVEPH